ncbi:hypothetical protein ACTNE0_11870, partial [Bacillota bacterium HCP3S3_E9]
QDKCVPAKVGKTWLQGGNSCHVKPEARGYSFLFRNYQGLFAAWTRCPPGRDFTVNKDPFPKRKMRQMAASCAFLIFFVSVPDVLT